MNRSATDTRDASYRTVVLVLCGLPGCGKSTLAAELVSALTQTSRCHHADDCSETQPTVRLNAAVHIEYDQVQEDICVAQLGCGNLEDFEPFLSSNRLTGQLDDGNVDTSSELELAAWRQSRSAALEQLRHALQQSEHRMNASQTDPSATTTTLVVHVDVIVMDDNFYWRSMRKQVYQTCQAQAECMHRPIYHATILLQAPLDVCLERNACRPRRLVAPHVLERMERTLESPVQSTVCPSTSAWWEQDPSCVLALPGTDPVRDNVARCLDFVNGLAVRTDDTGRVVATAHAVAKLALSEAIRQQDRLATAQSVAHQSDQFWRKCVAATVQRHASWGALANRVRQYCRQVWGREPEQRRVFDPHVCWNLFCNGLPPNEQTPDSSWLSSEDKDFVRRQLVTYFNQDADFDAHSVPQIYGKEITNSCTG
jgi:tRNA uridine 5-carbamoylmethylation protein Kti12